MARLISKHIPTSASRHPAVFQTERKKICLNLSSAKWNDFVTQMSHNTVWRFVTMLILSVFAVHPGSNRVWADQTESISVVPMHAELNGNLSRLQLLVTGTTPTGDQFDLTKNVDYENLAAGVVAVSKTGKVVPLSPGDGRIRIRHGRFTADVTVTVAGILPQAEASFHADVIPILTRAGCNQGACHGAQYGKGGFKLSLLGFAPEQDYPQLVRDLKGRRVSLIRPDDSLILQKATMKLAHGGGKRFRTDSYDYQVLKAWLAYGAPEEHAEEAELVDLSISPAERTYRQIGQQQQLRVVAHYNDGRTRDVTLAAKYDNLAEGVATVDSDGIVTVVGHGQGAVMVRFQGQAKVSNVISPYRENVDLADFEPRNYIDTKTKSLWNRLGVRPAGLSSDAEFMRRAFLDSIGTLPHPDRAEEFLKSSEPNKRDALVDELLGLTGDANRDVYINEWSAYWALKWGDLLRNNRDGIGSTGGMWALSNWIRKSLRDNMPVDQFVRRIITAQGSTLKNGPVNYYMIAEKPTDLAETTAQVFLGVRLQCARCHHHPYEVYSQADYYGLAAFFTRVGTKRSTAFGVMGGDTVVKLNPTGSISHPRTEKVMEPTPLNDKPVETAGIRDLRQPLADWITAADNDLFARNVVNRIWGYFLGSGLVEPIDDMRATNPPSNPELLDALADDFVANGYNLRKLMRVIMTSRVYQLSSTPLQENVGDSRLYLHYNVKRLPAEVLLDAIDFSTGTQERFEGVPLGTRAIELPDPNFNSYFLDTLGRPKRVIACECERTATPNFAQVLHIANGELIDRKLRDKTGRISNLIDRKPGDEQVVRELFLATVSRPATSREIVDCRQIIERADNYREGLEDLLWALINSREFLFNH